MSRILRVAHRCPSRRLRGSLVDAQDDPRISASGPLGANVRGPPRVRAAVLALWRGELPRRSPNSEPPDLAAVSAISPRGREGLSLRPGYRASRVPAAEAGLVVRDRPLRCRGALRPPRRSRPSRTARTPPPPIRQSDEASGDPRAPARARRSRPLRCTRLLT